MSDAAESFDNFEIAAPEDALVVTVDGFEGPLDLLLTRRSGSANTRPSAMHSSASCASYIAGLAK